MQHADWLFLFVGFFCLLGFSVSLILYLANRNQSLSPRLLAAVLFCVSYSLFGYLLYISREFLRFPHFYRSGVFPSLCVAPLAYIYVRSSLEQAFRFKKLDFIFFIPAFLYTAQFIPFYLLPASEKIVYIRKAIENKSFGAREMEALLPPGVGFILRMTYSLCLLSATYFLLYRWKKNNPGMLLIAENKEMFNWLAYLSVVLSSTFLALIISFVFQVNRFFEQYKVATITVMLSILFICSYLMFRPNILYGLVGWAFLPGKDVTAEAQDTGEQDDRPAFTFEQGQAFKTAIQERFAKGRSFLKYRYSIRDLSLDTGIPTYQLSAFINQEYGKNFNEFVNENRINYILEFVRENPDSLQQYTLEVLGQKAGFNSRSSFIAAMKKKTGKTPSEVFGKSFSGA